MHARLERLLHARSTRTTQALLVRAITEIKAATHKVPDICAAGTGTLFGGCATGTAVYYQVRNRAFAPATASEAIF